MDGKAIALMIGGWAVVFLVLAVLILFISLMGLVFKASTKKGSPEPNISGQNATSQGPSSQKIDPAFIAAITAAIHKLNPVEEGRNLRIKSIVPVQPVLQNITDHALIAAVTAAVQKANPTEDGRSLRIKSIRQA